MSIAALTTTTLSAALNASATRFAIGSTTGVNGLGSLTAPQSTLIVDGEAMLVQNVPVSGVVEVMRGAHGTKARPHASGAPVFVGAASRFTSLSPDGNLEMGEGGTPAGVLPNYMLPLGSTRQLYGKVYQLVDFQETVHKGVVVGISNDGLYTASVLTASHQGTVGVVAEETTGSDMWGWVQIYGSCVCQEAGGTSAITSAYVPIVAASVSSPAAGMTAVINTTSTPQRVIYGMFITGAATTNVTSAASHTGVGLPLFLDYPYVLSAATDLGMS